MPELKELPGHYYKGNGYDTDNLIKSLDDGALLAHMGVPLKYTPFAPDIAVDDMDPKIQMWLENLPYIFRPSFDQLKEKPNLCGMGLLLYGPPSTRKTTTAAAVLLRAVRAGLMNTDPTGHNFTWHGWAMGRFVDWQEASEVFRNANDDEDADVEANEIRKAMIPSGPSINRGDYLLLDDISRERVTEYNTGELQRIVRRRADNGYPTIVTTNTFPEEWAVRHGEVLAGFLNRAFIRVEFS